MRIPLHLFLALALTALTCDVSAMCAALETEGKCCCKTPDGTSPCSDLFGERDAPNAPEPLAAVESGERFASAILDAAVAPAVATVVPELREGNPALAPGVGGTPLYIQNCSFLC